MTSTISTTTTSAAVAAAPPYNPKIRQKVICAILLAGATFVMEVPDKSHPEQKHFAFWMALLKHPPSLRIFRSLLEWNLVLWGTVISLTLWYKYVGQTMTGELLFRAAGDATDYDDSTSTAQMYANERLHGSSSHMYEPMAGMNVQDLTTSSTYDWTNPNGETTQAITNSTDMEFANKKPYKDGDSYKDQESSSDGEEGDDEKEENKEQPKTVEIIEEEAPPSPIPFDAHTRVAHPPNISNTAGAALDMLLPILLALFLFTFLSTTTSSTIYLQWTAPLIPLLLVLYLVVFQLVRPWKVRKNFFIVISWTMGAPLFPVSFRDGFIGDVFTSTVRPLQDAAFTLCYFLSGLQGYWSDGYEGFWDSVNNNPDHLNDDDDALEPIVTEPPHSLLPPLETSWFLHTVLLPMCMVSPLWWRFLQNLRQVHDTRKRWPYLGNAFKYLLAAEVAMFGVFDPSKQQTWHWLLWFTLATLYQIWWDIFMDWELLVPNTSWNGSGYKLRDKRLYPSSSFYVFILGINILLRFCWTLSFLPPRYLNQAGVLSDTFQHSDWSRALAPAIASAEIIRRTMWGWLRLENEAIKVQSQEQTQQKQLELQYRGDDPEEAYGDVLVFDDLQPMSFGDHHHQGRMSFSRKQGIIPTLLQNAKTMEHASEIQVLAELALWATVFTTVGLVAAAHRMTL